MQNYNKKNKQPNKYSFNGLFVPFELLNTNYSNKSCKKLYSSYFGITLNGQSCRTNVSFQNMKNGSGKMSFAQKTIKKKHKTANNLHNRRLFNRICIIL